MRLFGFDVSVKRGSIESPTTPANAIFGEAPSSSGVSVTEQSALKFSAVWACIRILSEGLASLPLEVYERTADGRKSASAHPVRRLLHDQPNDNMTSFVFRETVQSHAVSWGNGYAFIEHKNGRPFALHPLMPDVTTVDRTDGKIVYKTKVNGQKVDLDPVEVLHIPGLGFDGMKGYSPIKMASDSIGIGLAIQQFGGRFFSQGQQPSGVLSVPGTLKDGQASNMREQWQSLYSGTENAHRVAVLEGEAKYQPITISPEDAQTLETRKFQITDIARIFRVPPHMLADLEGATFSNIEQQSLEFVVHSLRPWLVRWEQEINRKLFSESERKKYFVEFNVSGLLRGDIASRYAAYAIGKQWGWLSTNDVRKKENLNPVDGGDVYLVPLNMADQAAPKQNEPRSIEPENSRLMSVLANSIQRISLAEQEGLVRAIRKHAESPDAFNEWAESWIEKRSGYIADTLQVDAGVAESHLRYSINNLFKSGDISAESECWAKTRAVELLQLYKGDDDGN